VWLRIAYFIIKFRAALIGLLLAMTVFMAYMGKDIRLSYDFMKIVPDTDEDMVFFKEFKKMFGEDGNLLVIGIKDSSVYEEKKFTEFYNLTHEISHLEGITEAISLARIGYMVANREEKRFQGQPLMSSPPASQAELDSLLGIFKEIKFYENILINTNNGATVILVNFEPDYLNSERRIALMNKILKIGKNFETKTNIKLHYGGLPYVRTVTAVMVKKELNMFLIISLCITAGVLFLFFRSLSPVIFPLILIVMVVIWTSGTIGLLGYKLTVLTGLLPPILVVIGIPNCVYLLTKFHQEYAKYGNKIKAIVVVVKKIGVVTLITNATTAVGFLVLYFTGVDALKEFGIVAGINIFNTFVISIVLIPAIFSWLPNPKPKHTKHLDFKGMNVVLDFFESLILQHRKFVYIGAVLVVIIALIGMARIRVVTYLVDDLPTESSIRKDLAFFEDNFKGVMPLEIMINTGKKKGYRKPETLEKIDELETKLRALDHVSPPISIVTFLKAANQAYFGTPDKFALPTKREAPFITSYLKANTDSAGLSRSFVDSTGQYLRISLKVADLGSIKLDEFINEKVNPIINSIFPTEGDIKAKATGTTLLFIKGNDFLIKNLLSSMLLAFCMIAAIMGMLFGNIRMIIISLIPNLIPLLMTAALMGYLGISLKPSTAIVFSIAFGISVDDTIHYLAKYRQELLAHHFDVIQAIKVSLRETGASMIYTSIVLFCGFVVFAASEFGGTIALGVLTSTTLMFAMFTNLILLPCLLYSFEVNKHAVKLLPIWGEEYDNFYLEDDDEEIDITLLEIKKSQNKEDNN
jgi:predicted RND superfamily exporter protein